MDWKRFFSFSGRASRLNYWRVQLAVLVGFAVVLSLTVAVTVAGGPGWAPFLLFAPLVAVIVAIGVRRLHDRNRSGWWLVLYWAGPLTTSALGEVGGSSMTAASALGVVVLMLAGFATAVWSFVDLGLLRGTAGINRFGSEPAPVRHFA